MTELDAAAARWAVAGRWDLVARLWEHAAAALPSWPVEIADERAVGRLGCAARRLPAYHMAGDGPAFFSAVMEAIANAAEGGLATIPCQSSWAADALETWEPGKRRRMAFLRYASVLGGAIACSALPVDSAAHRKACRRIHLR